MNNQKIFHIVDHFGLGGVQRLISGLVGTGYGKLVFANHNKGKMIANLPANTRLITGGNSVFAFPKSFLRLHRLFQEENPTRVHCFLTTGVLIGTALSFLHPDVEFIFHEQGDFLHNTPGYKALIQLAAKRGKLIACSRYMQNLVKNTLPNVNIQTIPNFINHNIFFPNPSAGENYRKEKEIGDEIKLVGFAGRLTGRKGWVYLLEAFARLNSLTTTLLIAGAGEDEAAIRKQISRLDLENVQLVGQEQDMAGFYNALDFFVMPSLVEPFGLTQLEAQACGVPVIVSDIDGINETVCSDNAAMVRPGNADEILNALIRLMNEPDYRDKLIIEGKKNARNFSPERFIELLTDIS